VQAQGRGPGLRIEVLEAVGGVLAPTSRIVEIDASVPLDNLHRAARPDDRADGGRGAGASEGPAAAPIDGGPLLTAQDISRSGKATPRTAGR
jgi:hypothetical protein